MRHRKAPQRVIAPDAKYANVNIAKLVNYVMKDGKKSTATRIVYAALDEVAKQTKQNALDAFDAALKNVAPAVEVKSKRVGGANYQIPMPVRGERRIQLAYRWLLEAARTKKGRPMHLKLAAEIIAAANNEGEAVKKRMDVHRMAEANRAFAHFAR